MTEDTITTTIENVFVNGQPLVITEVIERDPYCGICGRCTDHVAEHDDLVAVGAAAYEPAFCVTWTELGLAARRLGALLAVIA